MLSLQLIPSSGGLRREDRRRPAQPCDGADAGERADGLRVKLETNPKASRIDSQHLSYWPDLGIEKWTFARVRPPFYP